VAVCHYNPSVYVSGDVTGVPDKVSLSKEHKTHIQTDCNDIWPQIAQFHKERRSTDLNLVT